MKYKCILFDLDGTLTDPCEGITKSVQHALLYFGIKETDMQKLTRFIGPPLKWAFSEYYGLSENDAATALVKYRERFSTVGWKENLLLDGAEDILKKLKKQGVIVCLATSKPYVFAQKILDLFDIEKYFDLAVGSELDGTRTDKADVVKYVLEHYPDIPKNQILMVGDRSHDVVGAHKNGVCCCGVLCGYGDHKELESAGAEYIVNNLYELWELVSK